MTNEELLQFLQDINACASDARDALTDNRLADVRTNLGVVIDLVREKIDEIDT